MTDTSVFHLGESAEQVAYKLLLHVASIEKKAINSGAKEGTVVPDRKWLLDAYAECLYAVHNPNVRIPDSG